MPATPSVPTANIKSITIGSSRNPGQLNIIGGKFVMSGGADVSTYNLLLDGLNEKILVGADDDIELDGANKRIKVGDTNVLIDGANKRIIINDSSDDRILIGYGSGLF